ncbi:MAG: M23 family metallopeptidase [Anaerovorax sp.]
MSNHGSLLLKTAPHIISSPFGYRINPITKVREGHNGVDYATFGKKVPCYPPVMGEVLKIGKDRFGALFVYVGFPTISKVGLYYHLDSTNVKMGQKVTTNTQIGVVGTTGQSTGIHLHFSWIEWNTLALNYNNADYVDFERYIFKQKEEDVINIKEIKLLVNGELKSKKGIIHEDENYIRLRDLNDLLTISYDEVKKLPVVKSK